MSLIGKRNNGAPGEIASALRASSLRDHRRFAPVSNLACGQVVELVLFMSGVRIYKRRAPYDLPAVLSSKNDGAPGEIRTPDLLVRSRKGDFIGSYFSTT